MSRVLVVLLVAVAGADAAAAPKEPEKGTPPEDTCYVDFVDIATGLAVLIRCRDDRDRVLNIIFDGGTSDAQIGKPLRDKFRFGYILDKGLGFPEGSTVNHLFQSHAHFDHHSDLIGDDGIIARYDVKHVWDPAKRNDSEAYGCFMRSVVRKANARELLYHPAVPCPDLVNMTCEGVRFKKFTSPTYIQPFETRSVDSPMTKAYAMNFAGVGGITGKILHANGTIKGDDHNLSSLVVMLDLFGVKLLLLGDEEAKPKDKSIEKLLIDAGEDVAANIVQVAHHGSDTSSTQAFLDKVIIRSGGRADTYAVISSGTVTYSGTALPRDEILTRWEDPSSGVGRGHLLSTKLYDEPFANRPLCPNHPEKIAPDPRNDKSTAGCNNIQFVIKKRRGKGVIESVQYWPLGPKVY